jgi:hypothetical protein
MKLLTCLVILCCATAVFAQSTAESESVEKKSPSRFDTPPALPQTLDEQLEAELSEVVYCARIRAFVFRMTEDERLEYVGTTTCPRPIGGGLKKIDRHPLRPVPALHAY